MTIAEEISGFREKFAAVRGELGRVIVGNEAVIEALLTAMLSGGNVLLEGVPGLGKTTLVRALGEALTLSFSRIQFTPDLMPADITGTHIITEDEKGRRAFAFRKGPLFSHLVLADEINRATPKTQSALLEAMQEHSVTVGGEHFRLEEPFFVLATQNPIEMEGTYPLPEAQLDRFFMKLLVPFPSTAELAGIVSRTTGAKVPTLTKVLDHEDFLRMAGLVREVILGDHARDYIARLIAATHPSSPDAPEITRQSVRYGASPRGGQALALAARVRALLDNRAHVAVEDIRAHTADVLRHRLILSFEAEAEGVRAEDVIAKIGEAVREKAE